MTSFQKTDENQDSRALLAKLIEQGRERGFLLIDKVKKLIPQEAQTDDKWEKLVSTFTELGINLVEKTDDITDVMEKPDVEEQEPDNSVIVSENASITTVIPGIKDPVRLI